MSQIKFEMREWLKENLNKECEVHYEMTPLGGYPLSRPRLASAQPCKYCGSDQFLTTVMYPDVNHYRVRLCYNECCVAHYPIKPPHVIKHRDIPDEVYEKFYDNHKIRSIPGLYEELLSWHKGGKKHDMIYGEENG